MIRAGVAVPPIMLLARWDSNCVLRYAKDAPLKNITADYKRGVRKERMKALTDEAEGLKKFSIKAMEQLKILEVEVAKHDQDLEDMNAKLAIFDSKLTPKYVISDKYQKWHICQKWQDVPSKEWRTLCGWRYAKSVFERRTELADNLKDTECCTTCFDLDAPDSE